MRKDQHQPDFSPETEPRPSEAQMFAEILRRLDALDKQKARSGPAQPARTLDLVELFYYLLSKVHIILLGMIAGALLLGAYATNRVVPVYTATSKLYIVGSTGASIIADLQIGTVLTMDYQEVFKTWEVHQLVNDELGTNYNYYYLQSMLTVTNPEDTRILYITVRNTDAKLAADIANAYASAAKRFITETMNTDEPSTFSIALVPGVATGGGITGYVIRGILLGTVLAAGLLVLIFLLDNRPKSPEDITQSADIPTLAVLPACPELSGDKKHKRKARRA